MNYTQYIAVLTPVCQEFTEGLDGRYSKYVSNEFIAAYLSRQTSLAMVERRNKHANPEQIAYDVATGLFESLLEYGCHAGFNGHHVAQNFCTHFVSTPVEELTDESQILRKTPVSQQ